MKIINLLFTIFLLFQSTPTFSMDEEEGEATHLTKIKLTSSRQVTEEDMGRFGCCNSGPCKFEDCCSHWAGPCRFEDCCSHWGLRRWICGIKEYVIDRCLCCTKCGFNRMDQNRAWELDDSTTDCCCIACSSLPGFRCCCPVFLYNNPITGTLCFPLAVATHLLCFPCACCSPNRDSGCYGGMNEEKRLYEAGKLKIEQEINEEKRLREAEKLKIEQEKLRLRIEAEKAYYASLTPQEEQEHEKQRKNTERILAESRDRQNAFDSYGRQYNPFHFFYTGPR